MQFVTCKRCEMQIAEIALESHLSHAHPKRHPGNLEALKKAQQVNAQRRAEIHAKAPVLEAKWNGTVSS